MSGPAPAIVTAISHIERELGVQLFLRHHAQGLSLTPAGCGLLRDSQQLLKQAEVDAFEAHCRERVSESYVPGMAGALQGAQRRRSKTA